jgi:hypothetical protein
MLYITVISAAAQSCMAPHKQTFTLLICCQSTLGHAHKQQKRSCAVAEVVESSAKVLSQLTCQMMSNRERIAIMTYTFELDCWPSQRQEAGIGCSRDLLRDVASVWTMRRSELQLAQRSGVNLCQPHTIPAHAEQQSTPDVIKPHLPDGLRTRPAPSSFE